MIPEQQSTRRAIIDVGSNSVRLVIYDGPARTPFVIHNEKVQARLGRGLAESGRIDAEAYDMALRGCRRFKALTDAIGFAQVRTVATAAARDAENGVEFLADLRVIGLNPELLSGDEEAFGSAAGVVSAFPGADGIVGDLGGGSLELIDVRNGIPGRRETFPLGALRLPALLAKGEMAFRQTIRALLKAGGWRKACLGRPFYLVGGSWRAVGHLDMHLARSILPGVHGYAFDHGRIRELREMIAASGSRLAKMVPAISSSRATTLDDAALLLGEVSEQIGCERLIVSTFGLREGLLFLDLAEAERSQDPLLAAITDYASRHGNPMWQGDRVADWIAPIFPEEGAQGFRLLRAACHLAGVDLHPQSETRARHAMELAWLGGWIGITAEERAMLAQAMWTAWAGKGRSAKPAGTFPEDVLRRAMRWGEAIRLAQRLTGRVSAVLEYTQLMRRGDQLTLRIDHKWQNLGGNVVAKQLAALAQTLGASAAIELR